MRSEKIGVLDVETTGLDKEKDRIVEITIRPLYKDDDSPIHLTARINPGIPIPPEIQNIIHIKDEDVSDMPTFGEIVDYVAARIEMLDVIIGYNPDFDIEILKNEFMRAGIEVKWPKYVICCKRLWDRLEPPPKRDLVHAYKRFVNPEGFDGAHSSIIDTLKTAELFLAIQERFSLQTTPWAELDPEREKWVGGTNHLIWNNEKTRILINFGKNRGRTVGEIDNGFWKWVLREDFPQHVKKLASVASQIPVPHYVVRDERLVSWAKDNI